MLSRDFQGRAYLFVPRLLIAAVLFGAVAVSQNIGRAADPTIAFVYIGTYTSGPSHGIYLFRMDLATGELKPAGTAPADNSSYLASDPAQRFLFSVGEMDHFQGRPEGTVTAFSRDSVTGGSDATQSAIVRRRGAVPRRRRSCRQKFARGELRRGKRRRITNRRRWRVAARERFHPASRLRAKSGSARERHAHGIAISPDNRFALVCDLGSDRIFVYRFDAQSGTLRPNDPPSIHAAPGAGPRHVVFHPNGKFVYAINELNSTVTMMSYNAEHGRLKAHQSISTLPPDAKLPATGNTAAELAIDPTGRFLYGSNRGHDTLAIFSIDRETGRLAAIGHQPTGHTPRGFAIDPTGNWLVVANQDSANVAVFLINHETGQLKPADAPVAVEKPACVEILER